MMDVSEVKIKTNMTGLKEELALWLADNLSKFESEQDGVDQAKSWIINNAGRFMEVVG